MYGNIKAQPWFFIMNVLFLVFCVAKVKKYFEFVLLIVWHISFLALRRKSRSVNEGRMTIEEHDFVKDFQYWSAPNLWN